MANKTNIPTNPQAPKRGDRVKAKDIQELAKQIKRVSRSGRENYVGAFYRAPDAPFTPKLRGKKDDPQAYEIALSKGYVIERRITDGQALIYHFPTGLIDEEDKLIYHSISEGQAIYVQVQVEDDGKIESDPVVMVAEDELEGEHFRPEVFDFGGNAGTHNYKIAKFEMVNEKPRLKLFGAGDNVDHYDERVGMINVKEESGGVTYEIGKTYESGDDKIHFRTLMQMEGDGQPIIKEDEEGAEKPDSIKFKRIIDNGTDAEIKVSDQDGAILIRGNQLNEDVNDAHKLNISIRDGLVVSINKIDDDGWWGTVYFGFTSAESYTTALLTFEAGILKTVEVDGELIEGTEAAPGTADIMFAP